MRIGLGLCVFLTAAASAFMLDGRHGGETVPAGDSLTTSSIGEETLRYKASVDGNALRCWLIAPASDDASYLFAGPECQRLGFDHLGTTHADLDASGDLVVSGPDGETVSRFFSGDGDGWEAMPGDGRLMSLIAVRD